MADSVKTMIEGNLKYFQTQLRDGFYVTPELELESSHFCFTIGGEVWNG